MNEERYTGKVQIVVTIASAVLIILLLVAAFSSGPGQEWRGVQKGFETLVEDLNDSLSSIRFDRNDRGIRQIAAEGLNRVDRCVTCHLGAEYPEMKERPHPFSYHPGDHLANHDPAEYGCTICHGGQGRALNAREAHATEPGVHWARPIHSQPFIQSSCGQCHLSIFAQSPSIEGIAVFLQGQQIFNREGCLGCHRARGVGGIIGPDLTEQGEKTKHDYDFRNIESEQTVSNWLKEHFRDPEMVSPGSEMLKIDLPDDELDALTTFVLGLAKPDIDFEYFTLEALNEFKGNRATLSHELAFSMACSGCHGKEGAGKDYEAYKTGVPGILNEDVGRVVSEDYIRFTLQKGRSQRQMASWQQEISGLRGEELDGLTAMIKWGRAPASKEAIADLGRSSAGKTVRNRVPRPDPEPVEQPLNKPNLESFKLSRFLAANPANGRQQFDRHCATCHGAAGKGDLAIAINQADFLSNASNEFLFNTLITGRGNATMPAWTNLPVTALHDLVRYMRSWHPYGPEQRSFDASRGDAEEGKLKYLFLCSRCHGEAGQGQTGPSLINRDLLRVADDAYLFNTIAYGRDHSAMFGWSTDVYNEERLSPGDIASIITYMRNKAEEQPAYIYSGANPGDRMAGRESYNAHCAECHGFEGEGPKAPALNNQEFLNAASNGYIAATITVGRKGTNMPEWGYPAEERDALTAKERHNIVAYIRDWQRIAIGF